MTSFEGESGLLAILDPSELKGGSQETGYNKTEHVITLTNGSTIMGFSAEKPSRLRGPQCHGMVLEEVSSWVNAKEAYDMSELGCRLPIPDTVTPHAHSDACPSACDKTEIRTPNPTRFLISSTPKRNAITRNLTKDPDIVIITESTYANAENLDPGFLKRMLRKYEGTTLGLQELHGVVLDDADGSLFKSPWFRTLRVTATLRRSQTSQHVPLGDKLPTSLLEAAIHATPTSPLQAMMTTRVGWDPAVTSVKGKSDLHGIIACGRLSAEGLAAAGFSDTGTTYDEATYDPVLLATATARASSGDPDALSFILNLRVKPQAGDIVILADRSGVLSPVAAAKRVIALCHEVGATEVALEQNQGYDTWKSVWREAGGEDSGIRLHALSATANKEVRATPLATAYEQAYNLQNTAPIRIFSLELADSAAGSAGARGSVTRGKADADEYTDESEESEALFADEILHAIPGSAITRQNEDEVSDGEVDTLEFLQDEMTSWVPAESAKSPNRIDALVHCVARLGIGVKPKTAVTRAGRLSELV